MFVRYISKVNKNHLEKFKEEQLCVPGRLFDKLYKYPEYYPYNISAVVAKDEDEVTGVCLYFDDFKFGYVGDCNGIVGVYVKPQHRNKGLGEQLVRRMVARNRRVMGHTYDLNRVARKIKSNRLVRIGAGCVFQK